MRKKESNRERRGKLGRAGGWEGGEGDREEREREGRRVDEYKSDKMSHPVYSPNVLRFWMDIRQTKEIPRIVYNCEAQAVVWQDVRSITLRQQ